MSHFNSLGRYYRNNTERRKEDRRTCESVCERMVRESWSILKTVSYGFFLSYFWAFNHHVTLVPSGSTSEFIKSSHMDYLWRQIEEKKKRVKSTIVQFFFMVLVFVEIYCQIKEKKKILRLLSLENRAKINHCLELNKMMTSNQKMHRKNPWVIKTGKHSKNTIYCRVIAPF